MNSSTFDSVTQYINDNILHSSVWDGADDITKKKAVNNSINSLILLLKGRFTTEEEIPIDILSQQTIWMLRIDDTFLRAEMGVTYVQMNGVMVNIAEKDRSIAPYVMEALNISPDLLTGGISRRKVAGYESRRTGTSQSIFRNYGYFNNGQARR